MGEIQKKILIYLDIAREPVSVSKLAAVLEVQPYLINLGLAQLLRMGLINIELQNGENVISRRTVELAEGNNQTSVALN